MEPQKYLQKAPTCCKHSQHEGFTNRLQIIEMYRNFNNGIFSHTLSCIRDFEFGTDKPIIFINICKHSQKEHF